MKKYYIKHGEFANIYELRYTIDADEEAEAISAGYERITRKEAEEYARQERARRKYDPAFSGYADADIYAWQIKKQ